MIMLSRHQNAFLATLVTLFGCNTDCEAASFFAQSGKLNVDSAGEALREGIQYSSGFMKHRNRKTQSISKKKSVYSILSEAQVIDPQTGKRGPAVDASMVGVNGGFPFQRRTNHKVLVVVMPQLGDVDSFEYAEYLRYVMDDLEAAQISLRIIGIGHPKSAHMFSLYTGIPLENIRVDPTAELHDSLRLHRGPKWDIPSWVPKEALEWFAKDVCGSDNEKAPAEEVVRAWVNYLAMYGGISAPGTLNEIVRGYLGDRSAPERLWPDEMIRLGPVTIKGVSDLKIGSMEHKSLWKDETGYLRPGELASSRMRYVMEVLPKFDHYVPDQRFLDWRGGTFLLDETSARQRNGKPLYEYQDRGVLSYSETMDRPLTFLTEYIGLERARNPMGLDDPEYIFSYDEGAGCGLQMETNYEETVDPSFAT